MTENSQTSEADKIFNARFIKVPFSGGYAKEIDSAIRTSIKSGKNLKYVIRSLDRYSLCCDKDLDRTDMGDYPEYLYDKNIFNDVKYVLNKEIFVDIELHIIKEKCIGEKGGVTSFDEYLNWSKWHLFGKEYVIGDSVYRGNPEVESDATSDEISTLKDNVQQNIIEVAKQNPEIEFYYFIPPYSVAWWGDTYFNGGLKRQLELDKITIEEILNNSNIKLFMFDDMEFISMNLDNYKDTGHYGEWINTDLLTHMKNNIGRVTLDNYE